MSKASNLPPKECDVIPIETDDGPGILTWQNGVPVPREVYEEDVLDIWIKPERSQEEIYIYGLEVLGLERDPRIEASLDISKIPAKLLRK